MFLETFTKAIEKSCKLAIPKSTIRNAINNPWKTDAGNGRIRVINHCKKETKQNIKHFMTIDGVSNT